MQREIDKLGRLVIPKEMRKQLEINEGDPVNIECIGDKIVITNPSGINYKQRIDKAIDKLTLLIDIGFDYDGFNQVDSLKTLIDELVSYARESRKILKGDSNE